MRVVHGTMLTAAAALAAVAIAVVGRMPLTLVPEWAPDVLRLDFATTLPALPFLALIVLVVPAVALWGLSRGGTHDGTRLAAFVVAMTAVFLAQSVAAFFLAWEAMALISAVLIAAHHERRAVRRALLSYLIVSQAGAFCILAALSLLAAHAGSARFADIAQAAASLAPGERSAAFALALIGFGSKAGLVPLHFWLPRAHPVAPANASALLSGVMLNVAVYGLLLAAFVLAAPLPAAWGFAVLALGLVSAVTGALFAAVESDLKRLLAYSSIENMGIIVATLGLAVAGAASRLWLVTDGALIALLLHVVSHGVFKSLLFLGAGTVAEAARTTNLEHLGGLRTALPFTAPFVLAGCLAAAALPPTGGFVAEWLVLQSFIRAPAATPAMLHGAMIVAVALLALAGGLAALAFAKLFGIAFLGASRTTHPVVAERIDASVAGLGWLALAVLGIGCVPGLVVRPLAWIAGALTGGAHVPAGTFPAYVAVPNAGWLGAYVALPILCGAGALVLARLRGVRRVPTWTCGSPVTVRSQYTATAFSKPVRRIFGFVLLPDRQRIADFGPSRWFPVRIRYTVTTRDVIDESARRAAAFGQRFARRARIVQAGRLRVYIAYAVAAVLVLLVAAR
jgi:formate hydrogenlyase subunit 3/multisubunit Na+/H+ antiporter MnhD subunit